MAELQRRIRAPFLNYYPCNWSSKTNCIQDDKIAEYPFYLLQFLFYDITTEWKSLAHPQ